MRIGAILLLACAPIALGGCSDESGGGDVKTDEDTGVEDDTASGGTTSCTTSDDCSDAAEGNLCGEDGVCGACETDDDCAEEYGEDSTCDEGSCTGEGTCTAGTIGCGCDGGTCSEGICESGMCVPCSTGAEGCGCNMDGTCNEGLVCVDGSCAPGMDACAEMPGSMGCPCEEGDCAGDLVCVEGTCQTCPSSMEGCPCVMGMCTGGLVCDAGACRGATTCIDAGCAEFQLCTEAPGMDAVCEEACEEGYTWTGTECQAAPSCEPDAPGSIADECVTANRTCVVNGLGEAMCGDCLAGYIVDGDTCRRPLGCDNVNCAAENRECIAGDMMTDATCGGCLVGFVEEGGACVADLTSNCDPGDPNSILDECMNQMRDCISGGDGAICGECIDDFVEDPGSGECRSLDQFIGCDSNEECPDGFSCIVLQPDTQSRCLPVPCDEGETWDLGDQECVSTCNCSGVGLTGDVWPTTDWNGDCVCETEPGFFFNTSIGSRQAEPCDADRDGWTRRNAFEHVTDIDIAVRINARCNVRSIDRVTLINEFGQAEDISILAATGQFESEDLYETNESDDESEAMERQENPYGERRFKASELNPMTKACVTALADYNDNGISDLREHQQLSIDQQERSWMTTFVRFGYFVELHTGWYEPPAEGQTHGRYVVMERSRCSDAFLLGYNDNDRPWWRDCSRRRDGAYEPFAPIGYDFARWGCDNNPAGECPILPPPTSELAVDEIPAHGLCEMRAEDPVDWRGMNHFSQFKCVEIVPEDAQDEPAPFQLSRDDIWLGPGDDDGTRHLNVCGLVACDSGDSDCVESSQLGQGDNPQGAEFSCDSDTSTVIPGDLTMLTGRVGFVSQRYIQPENGLPYQGGCISEWDEWPQLCPGFDPNLVSSDPNSSPTQGISNEGNFGRLVCGCGFNYGGPECDLGCPDEQVHYGGSNPPDSPGACDNGYCISTSDEGGEEGGRSGYWMCGDFTTTAYTSFDENVGGAFSADSQLIIGGEIIPGTITIRGSMPAAGGTDGTPLCENADENGNCTTGYTVR
ncbi:MAG: hypothetical protein AAFS10_04870 [Myxococcota bacterium]